jgi:hypothetical protein
MRSSRLLCWGLCRGWGNPVKLIKDGAHGGVRSYTYGRIQANPSSVLPAGLYSQPIQP